MELRVGEAVVRLVLGDICDSDAEAIVNAANNNFWMGGGVAGAIKRRGGGGIEREAVAKGPVRVGESVVTGAGSLSARHVIHAAVMGQDLQTDAEKIAAATRSALARAEELGLRSIAFPALGTGVGGFPLAEAARLMLGETRAHLGRGGSLREVVFVLRDEPAYRAFEKVMAGLA